MEPGRHLSEAVEHGLMKIRLLSKFMHRGGEKNNGPQPSPEEQPLDSPTSPVSIRPLMPAGLYSKSGTNGSDMSLVARSMSTSILAEKERLGARGFGTFKFVLGVWINTILREKSPHDYLVTLLRCPRYRRSAVFVLAVYVDVSLSSQRLQTRAHRRLFLGGL
jgi:hypothetical protein